MSKKKKKKNNENNEDRISLLPDCLLHHILSFLDTTQVVQTCVLSKRRNTVWTTIPILYFFYDDYPLSWSTDSTTLIEDTESRVRSFNHFFSRVLSKHCGSNIKTLRYFAWDMDHDDKYIREFLISYAACHMVQELDIKTSAEGNYDFDWLRCLSACQSLNILKIHSYFPDEWGVLMLQSLRILEIESYCSDEYILVLNHKEKLFSGCPNLESLVLDDVIWEGCATICAPKLENFKYCCTSISDSILSFQEIELCTPNLRCVTFSDVIPAVKSALDFPCLDTVNIKGAFHDDGIIEYGQGVAQLLRVFHNARSITMPLDATRALLSIPPALSATLWFDNLRHLVLKAHRFRKKINLPYELQYLLNCPTLKSVVISFT